MAQGVHEGLKGTKKWLLITVMTILLIEFSIRAFDIDLILIEPTLYYQCEALEVYRPSADQELIYETVPGKSARVFRIAGDMESNYKYISINLFGFRGKYPESAETNRTRIIIFGGSNTFGGIASDNETYPYFMQRLFDERYPGKFEVINAGRDAYQESQVAAFADSVTSAFKPDLVIIQRYNFGRRAFLPGEHIQYFKENPDLYNENIPILITDNRMLFWMHHKSVRISAIYRVVSIIINTRIIEHYRICYTPQWEYGCNNFVPRLNRYGDLISERYLKDFINSNPDLPIIIFYPTVKTYCGNFSMDFNPPNLRYFSLCKERDDPEFNEIHPKIYVYEAYAEEILEMLDKEYPSLMEEG